MITLYKKDTKDKIRYLTVSVNGSELSQKSGVLFTEHPLEHKKVCKGKNIGRSNETTPEDQAVKEMDSLIVEKLKEGYFKTIKEAQEEETLFPMLAKDYTKEKKKIDWKKNVYIQPKLDGMRCLITVNHDGVTLKSRDGRYIETMHHIAESFEGVAHNTYDGELYAHGLSFQENMELIKKWVPEENGSVLVKFHCYDVVSDKSFTERLKIRDTNLSDLNTVEFVTTMNIKSQEELDKHHQTFLAKGYEGSIVRHGLDGYKINGRSSNLLKYKDFQDIAVEIVDITPADQRPEWGVPVLRLSDGRTFRAGTKMSHESRKDLLINKDAYIGKIGEIRFFEYSDEGIPRFPVMVGIRLDKNKGDK